MKRIYDVSNLRVAVVPVGSGIDQGSDVDEILACPELELYPLTDYFKAQNDEDFDKGSYWTFLIDIEEKSDYTGCNMDGIHCNLV